MRGAQVAAGESSQRWGLRVFQELCQSTLTEMESQKQLCRPLTCEKSKPVPLKLFTPRLVKVWVLAASPQGAGTVGSVGGDRGCLPVLQLSR